ncbi:MAG: Tyrosine recombinase XerC [Chroococcidiopsis sp. SAG 2025]|uniref:Arm DNA-binding domain-containing protein n=1 Tax=Chroococcidiopsis sp. SAG 2025 TaxID=171389 RepID=UPI0029370B8A|nr:tyrosine-type recombinase/integrase [Chroococcidiopsis sp. SAG 2025]MDV2991845.1 Tyrosine recombinase XerC [Chroococcidiopsis sp. SAG 2025]
MQTNRKAGKAFKGSVQIKSSNNRLQLVFSYGGKRHYLSTGFPDTSQYQKLAKMKASEIEKEILYERFDQTLEKYKPKSALSTVTPIPPIFTPKVNLAEIWDKYVEWKRLQCAPSTMKNQYHAYSSYLKRLPTHDLDRANDIRDCVLQTIPINSAKRFIVALNSCCQWAVKSGLIAENPFYGMAGEIKLPKPEKAEDDIDPFSLAERDKIIQAFRCDRYYKFYAPLVEFLFNTGARPSEAIALQWKHVTSDLKFISFEQAVTVSEKGLAVKQGLKTQEKRRFPCNAKVQAILSSIKPENTKPDDLLFPSPAGKYIDFHNFRNRAWKTVLAGLDINYRKPYQTRHTFITLALENGLDAKDVARLVGNSPEIIYRHYAGNKRELFVPEF